MADEAGTRTILRRCTALTLTALLLTPSTAAADRLRTIDVASGTSAILASSPNLEWIDRPCWAPDGRVVALEYRSTRWSLQRRYMAYRSLDSRAVLAGASRFVGHAQLAPACGRVAEARRRLVDGGRGTVVRELFGLPVATLRSYGSLGGPRVAWSADGALLAGMDDSAGEPAIVVLDGLIHLLDLEGRDLGIVAPAGRTLDVARSPDGTQLAFTTLRPTGTRHYVVPAEPGAPHRLLLATRALSSTPLAWSPDGTRLAVGGG